MATAPETLPGSERVACRRAIQRPQGTHVEAAVGQRVAGTFALKPEAPDVPGLLFCPISKLLGGGVYWPHEGRMGSTSAAPPPASTTAPPAEEVIRGRAWSRRCRP
jgi:hypothetical protein